MNLDRKMAGESMARKRATAEVKLISDEAIFAHELQFEMAGTTKQVQAQ